MEIYTYTPLNLDEPSFRLVRLFGGVGRELQCELIHALLKPSDVMDYEAVSYTWGVVPHPVSFLEIHGETIKKLPIHYNLYRVLLDLRLVDEDRMLWIDAICINQGTQDATERNHQVQQMAEIYKTAQRVLVWLGPSTQEMDLAMVSLLEFQSLFKEMKWKAEEIRASDTWKRFESSASREHDDPRYLGIKKIFNQPWFRRIWVLQEVGNARAVIIHCGKKAVSSATFLLAPSVYQIEVDKHCQAVLDLMPASSARSQHGGQYRDLRKLLRDFRGAEATREHDKVYALLGLCHGKGKDLRISYEKPISEVISEVISHICYYEVGSTPVPLYKSIREFQSDLDDLEDKQPKKHFGTTGHKIYRVRGIFENRR
ncbi:heterokaryon incompatibility protein-domain-containing protein [Nemania abortiva]|nr:heterokaryon incompatibility protein-domain-containing protein [Nemania abortiva]